MRAPAVPLTKKERFRRVTLLCCHFVRNLAYDQAGRKSIIELEEAGDFWATVLNNFLNCCVKTPRLTRGLAIYSPNGKPNDFSDVVPFGKIWSSVAISRCGRSSIPYVSLCEDGDLYTEGYQRDGSSNIANTCRPRVAGGCARCLLPLASTVRFPIQHLSTRRRARASLSCSCSSSGE